MWGNFSFDNFFTNWRFKRALSKVQIPLEQAVTEINRRRQDAKLRQEIGRFLENDIPLHFNNRLPIFYLSRYVATPDYETLQFVDLVKKYEFPIVIGEDTTDIFTSHSSLKRNLAKLPVITGVSKDGSGIVEYETIANFNSEQGKQLRDVETFHKVSLPTFHRNLARHFFPPTVSIVDESSWVDRHSRGKLVELYESMLALLLVHGIMLEHYEPDELDFLEDVVAPAFETTYRRFGYKPLISPLKLQYSKKIKDLNSYPASVQERIRETRV